MKLIIDIDDDLYTRLFDNGEGNLIDMQEVCAGSFGYLYCIF